MPARRRYYSRRSGRPLKTVKYSNETYGFSIVRKPEDGEQTRFASATLVTKSEVGGMRKAKNFTIKLYTNSSLPVLFALIYVPAGTTPGQFNVPGAMASASVYEPNQNVILSGIVQNNNPVTLRTRLARNINSGDSIVVIAFINQRPGEGQFIELFGTCNYAITY